MDTKGSIFGLGSLLRQEVSGWATSGAGTPHVYPDHPPLNELGKESYPRATVDIIGNEPDDQNIEQSILLNDVLFEITVYTVNSGKLNELLGNCISGVVSHWEDYMTEEWSLNELEQISPTLEQDAEAGFTRYQKGVEIRFDNVLTV